MTCCTAGTEGDDFGNGKQRPCVGSTAPDLDLRSDLIWEGEGRGRVCPGEEMDRVVQ